MILHLVRMFAYWDKSVNLVCKVFNTTDLGCLTPTKMLDCAKT